MNRLNKQRAYLAGAIDREADRGKGWRDNITPFLNNLGVTVFNPLIKPGEIGKEDENTSYFKKQLKKDGRYDELSKVMKTIRGVDLRLVDISDFLIVNLDLNTHPCGTYEEIFLANRQKKPILVRVVQGKENAPDWLFGTIPHNMIFTYWNEVMGYLEHINSGIEVESQNRWYFFDIKAD
jgi:nucleoside 2-deoxyribosyltransferase